MQDNDVHSVYGHLTFSQIQRSQLFCQIISFIALKSKLGIKKILVNKPDLNSEAWLLNDLTFIFYYRADQALQNDGRVCRKSCFHTSTTSLSLSLSRSFLSIYLPSRTVCSTCDTVFTDVIVLNDIIEQASRRPSARRMTMVEETPRWISCQTWPPPPAPISGLPANCVCPSYMASWPGYSEIM